MSPTETDSESPAKESRPKVIGYDDKDPLGPAFIVKSPTGHALRISDTFAEIFTTMEISPAQSPFFC